LNGLGLGSGDLIKEVVHEPGKLQSQAADQILAPGYKGSFPPFAEQEAFLNQLRDGLTDGKAAYPKFFRELVLGWNFLSGFKLFI
jgi:hypothetical protein